MARAECEHNTLRVGLQRALLHCASRSPDASRHTLLCLLLLLLLLLSRGTRTLAPPVRWA
jgi:hypothetical protein